MHLFYLDNLPNTIVLLCCGPVRCRVAELVPHFTLHALRTALYMLFPWSIAQQHNEIVLGSLVPLSSTTAAMQMSDMFPRGCGLRKQMRCQLKRLTVLKFCRLVNSVLALVY